MVSSIQALVSGQDIIGTIVNCQNAVNQNSLKDVHRSRISAAAAAVLATAATADKVSYTELLLSEVAVVVGRVHNNNSSSSHLLS